MVGRESCISVATEEREWCGPNGSFTVPDLLLLVVLALASFAEQLGLNDPPPAPLPKIDYTSS
jgi:hypothetical protein